MRSESVQLLLKRLFIFQCGFATMYGICWSWTCHATTAYPARTREVIATSNTHSQLAQTSSDTDVTRPSDPNRDRILQPVPTPPVIPEDSQPVLTPSPPDKVEPEQPQPSQSFFVKDIVVKDSKGKDSTILSTAEIDAIVRPFEGRSVTLQELGSVADAITQKYLNRGYITSRAVLGDQTITDGIVQIRVFEGGVEEIRIEGVKRVNPGYIRSRIRLAGLNPLRKDRLEDQLILLRTDPLFKNVEGSLRPGSQFGQSILIVRVEEANPFQAVFNIDNYSPPSVGSERFGIGLAYRNVTGLGDRITAAYNRSTTGGANLFDFSYQIPLNAKNGTLQLRAALSDYKITDPAFDDLNIRGDSDLYEISYRQPLIRTPRQELALSFGFTFQDGQTFLFDNRPFGFGRGPDEDGVSRTSVFKFGQDYVKRDPKGAWAFRSQFSFGTGLFDATINSNPIPDSRFFSWFAQVQRVQQLNNDNLLIVDLDLQLTQNSLLPSQQFIIGGGQSVRGYRQNARYGDNGLRFSIEDRITLQRNEAGAATLQIAPFIDLGTVWNQSDNPNSIPRQKFLAGGGLGILWEPIPRLNLRLDYGLPFVDLRDRGDNAQDSGFYFSVNYQP